MPESERDGEMIERQRINKTNGVYESDEPKINEIKYIHIDETREKKKKTY